MGAREERLTPATRNYVIFGLLFVLAVGLAICEWVDPRTRRGEADSALRLLVISDAQLGVVPAVIDADGFFAVQLEPAQVIDEGRELLQDLAAPAYQAALTYADQHGYGFLALDLRAADGDVVDWGLGGDHVPARSVRFAVFSVGDVAVEGPRMHSVSLPDTVELAPRLAELDGLRLALYDHPDLQRLWTIEPNGSQLQAREVLSSRGIVERREQLHRDHAAWREFAHAWPAPGSIAGSLADPWESVRATPIRDGLLLEIRRVQVHVDVYRRPSLERDEQATLAFLPAAALSGSSAGASEGRRPCPGLPERIDGELAVAADGSAVSVPRGAGAVELFVFEQGQGCSARSVGWVQAGTSLTSRPSSAGAIAWTSDGDLLEWRDALGEQQALIPGVAGGSFSGPWWVHGELLAAIGESGLVVLETRGEDRGRVEFSAGELLPRDPDLEPAVLVDLRPSGVDALLVATTRCDEAAIGARRPCWHRLRGAAPYEALFEALEAKMLTVETLGPLGDGLDLAIAGDGSRAVWVDGDSDRRLMIADLRGPARPVPRRLDEQAHRQHSPQISADGRLVTTEAEVEIVIGGHGVGSVLVGRALTLDPAPADPE